jgi:RNA polymerase sigma factor (sigma-70 family)
MRLQSDERLVALTRRGNESAFETLVTRYRARLQAFIRHMVGSTEDAEDILQEVFVAAHKAMLADDRPINVRPWLYRIARNRSLNHLRRPKATGVDSMDIYEGGAAVATADRVHDKLELEELIGDVKSLPETQRTALLLREMGQLSYDQIAVAMETSVPSVKSLLVRARVSLAEASEARKMTCDEVRIELAAEAEGIQKISAPGKRHVQGCERCRGFKKELAVNNRKLAMIAPIGLLALAKHAFALKLLGVSGGFSALGIGGSSSGAGAAGAAGAGAAAAGAGAAGVGTAATAGTGLGMGAIVGSTAAGLATVAIAVGGVAQVASDEKGSASEGVRPVTAAIAPSIEDAESDRRATRASRSVPPLADAARKTKLADTKPTEPVAVTPPPADDVTAPVAEPEPAPAPEPPPVIDEETSAVVLDPTTPGPSEPVAPPATPPANEGPTGGTSQSGEDDGASAEIGGAGGEFAE